MTGLAVALWWLAAGGAPGAPLSLPEALAEAERRAPEVVAARAREATARAGISAAGALPATTLSVGTGQSDPLWSVGVSQRFPAFGARSSRIDAAAAEADSARLEALQAATAARADARRAYFSLVRADDRLALAARTLALARTAEAAARARFETGAAPRLDVVQAQLARATADTALAGQEAERAASSAELALLLGRDPTQPLAAQGGTPPTLPALDAVLAAARTGPLAQAREADVRAAQARLDAARADRLPSPTVGVAAEHPLDARGQNLPNLTVRGTLDLELPLLGFNSGEIAVARAQVEEARLRRDADALQRTAALFSAQRRLAAALATAARYREEILPAATEAEGMALDAYRAGRSPLTTLLEAQRAAAETRAQAVDAAFAAQEAFAQLEAAAGVPLDAR